LDGLERSDLAYHKDKCQALVDKIMNYFWVLKKFGEFVTGWGNSSF
jgi:hypothetical protein